MNGSNESTPIEKLTANILETRFENLDQDTIDYAKIRIIDVLGCLIGGANAPGNLGIIDLVRDWGGKEEATILIHGGKVPIQNAAMVNCITARSFDYEPVSPLVDGLAMGGHLSGTTVMTAITIGEVKDISGQELLATLLVGDDMASRVLAAESGKFLSWPKWPTTGTINTFGATAIAGRLLGLNAYQMRNAFGIALNQLAGTFQMIWDRTTAFKVDQGTSARNGIFSAQLAGAGWTGPEDALLSKYGYYQLFAEGCRNPEALTTELGRIFYSDGTIKPYPCCRITHGAIDCALAIVNKNSIDARDIREVTLYVSPVAAGHVCAQPFVIGDFPHCNAAFNFQYTVATALMNRSVRPEHFTEESVRSPRVYDIIKKIKIAQIPETEMSATRLKVIMNDGRELIESCDVPRGDQLHNPLSYDEIIAKFWTNVEFSGKITKKNAESLLALLENLEEVDDVHEIIRLLVM
jgi:2-methylcitrate dehydratase PrpD